MTIGDFNIVTSQDEKCGGNTIKLNEVNNFNTMIANLGLADRGYFRNKYT